MALTIADQIALDDALVTPADRLKIGKCNLRLRSDITSKEATLQVVYDVLKLTHRSTSFPIHMLKLIDLYAGIPGFCLCSQSIGPIQDKIQEAHHCLRLSQAQILWSMYNQKNVDYAYLLWEDFIFKIENKSMKKGSAMYYTSFNQVVSNYVMERRSLLFREETRTIGTTPEMTNFTIIVFHYQ
ncbi:hypothetical protein Tco_0596295 [Tanacetum coccineum]